MLTISGVHSRYGSAPILRGLDLEVGAGEVVGLLGRNGMGKTTLVRSIAGLSPPNMTDGEIRLDGEVISGMSPQDIGKRGIGLVPQGRHVFGSLTVVENLTVAARPGPDGDDSWTLDRAYGFFPRLQERSDSKARTLSGGEQQMLAIARALMSRPKLLLCDEPSLGLAPLLTAHVFDLLEALHQERRLSILLVEQNANLALRLASRVYLLEAGTIVRSGTPGDVVGDGSLRRAYLGY
jgi:branched-chain amino acid transport system ATP-binding protein